MNSDGDTPDWLELHNYGTTAVSLLNWGLSNNFDDLQKWQFPDITLKPNEYLLLWASGKDKKEVSVARTLVNQGATFRYLIPSSEPDANWTKVGFNSSSWLSGASGFGYADGDDNTTVPAGTISVYARIPFAMTNINSLSSIVLDIDYDDGFVAYINGVEVARANLNGSPPAFDATAFQDHEAQMYSGGAPTRFTVNNAKDLLVEGENVLAIQVHNVNATSSDMTLIPHLTAIFSSTSSLGVNPPAILNFSTQYDLHSNFKISGTSESLFLSDANKKIVDQLLVEGLNPDTSFGFSTLSNKYVYYTETTPGYQNSDKEFVGVLGENIVFSHEGGFVNAPILNLSLSGKTGSQIIRYTTDATEPNENSPIYSAPITINKNTVVRARLMQSNYISSLTQTKSYIFNANHQIDVVFLETDPYNFFDQEYGIYVKGTSYNPNAPYFGANFWEDWERPIHFSFYSKDTKKVETEFDAGVKIFGGWSRGLNEQRSLAFYARGEYGTSEFKYPFFDKLSYSKFKSLVLRNSGNDCLSSNIRDISMTSLMEGTGLDYQAFKPVATYLNGEYWGMYNMREKIDEDFLATKHNLDPDDINLLQFNGEVIKGDNSDFSALLNYVSTTDLVNDTNFQFVKDKVDLENFAVYQLAEIYFDNTDWPHNNIKFWNHPEGKFRWILFDTDFGFGLFNVEDVNRNTLSFATRDNEWSTLLLRSLLRNISFRNQFINRFADEMNSRFLPQNVKNHFDSVFQMVAPEITAHYHRWNRNPSDATWQLAVMKNFAERRPNIVKDNIKSKFGLNAYHRLSIANSTPSNGFVIVNNNLKIKQSAWNGDYFEDVPVSLKAIAEKGYEFSHWTGEVNSTDAAIQLNLKNMSSVTAHFVVAKTKPPVINEINYKSGDEVNADDWVELYNPNEVALNLSNWTLKDNDDTHIFNIPSNTSIEPKGYLVFVKDKTSFGTAFPSILNYYGELGFGLGGTDSVRLYNENGILQDEVNYDSVAPWSVEADGKGPTLELIAPELDNLIAENWKSINKFGSPNAENILQQIEEEEKEYQFSFYPNPLNINKTLNIKGIILESVEIYSISGLKVYEQDYDNVDAAELNLISLNSGIYLVKINQNIIRKLIVL